MKVFIIGGSGSGKSYIANKLSRKTGIEHFDLDNVFWDNKSNSYGIKKEVVKRDLELNGILEKDKWVIEGVYYKWTGEVIKNADKVFLLKVSPYIYNYRIVMRFVKRKLKLEKSNKKETLKGLYNLILWNTKYNKESYKEIMEIYREYLYKIEVVTDSENIVKWSEIY